LRVQLFLPFARLASADLSQTHLSTSAPLSRPDHHRSVSGQLYETPSGGTGHGISFSCRLSATGIRFLDILFPPGTFSFPYSRPTDPHRPDPVGVSIEARDNGAHKNSHSFTLPAFPLPAAAGWNGNPLGFSPGFAPHDYSRRTPRMGTDPGH
jgi:hypothetical protein